MQLENKIHSKKIFAKLIGLTLCSLMVATSAVAAPADPFVGGTWHAIGETWPGTAKFSDKDKQVVLSPIGAAEIKATYKVIPEKSKTVNVFSGKLTMTNALGQVVTSDFVITGKTKLALTFSGGQRVETYVMLTPAQEATETKRIEQLIREGKLTSSRDTASATGNSAQSILHKGVKNIELP